MRRLLGWILAWIVALWVRTLRVRVIDRTHPSDHAVPRPWVLVFWHGTQFALLGWQRRRKTAVMVSWSRDGELQERVMRRNGMHVVRGSSSKGGARGLVAMVHAMRDLALDAAFAVDGPRGPLGTVHPGALACARHAAGVVVPIGSASSPSRMLARTWDKMILPLPFAQAVVVVGPVLPATSSEGEIAAAIDDANGLAARTLSGSPDGAEATT